MIYRSCKHCGQPDCEIRSTCRHPNYGGAQCEFAPCRPWLVWKSRAGARPDMTAVPPSFLSLLQLHEANEVWHSTDHQTWHIAFTRDYSAQEKAAE